MANLADSKKRFFYSFCRIAGFYNTIVFHATNEEEATQIRKNVGFSGEIKIAPNLPPVNHLNFKEKDNGR